MFFYLFCVQGGYEAVPTRDIHMNQIGETTMQRFGSVGLDPIKIGKRRIKKNGSYRYLPEVETVWKEQN